MPLIAPAHEEPIGLTIKHLRRERGVKAKDLAAELGTAPATLSRWETGRAKPTVQHLERIASVLALSPEESQQLMRLAEDPPRANRLAQLKQAQERLSHIEERALTIRVFHHAGVPGLLQTPPQAAAVFSGLGRIFGALPDQDEAVKARAVRQLLLVRHPEKFHFVLTEGGLRTPTSDRLAWIEQLTHLQWLINIRNADVGIVPLLKQVPVMPICDFYIFDRSAVVVESLTHEYVLENPGDIDIYEETFNSMRATAKTGAEALRLLDGIVEDIRADGEALEATDT